MDLISIRRKYKNIRNIIIAICILVLVIIFGLVIKELNKKSKYQKVYTSYENQIKQLQGGQQEGEEHKTQEQKEAEQPVPTEKFAKRKKSKRNGIIFWGTWPFKHSYVLSKGSNTIGREDEEEPSDIQLKDSYVSRRSIDIEVLDSESGYLFKLTVRKATNPVYINGQEHDEGTSIYLNDGDTIHLGSKKLRFALEDKK